MWRTLFQSLFFDPLALACVRDVLFRKVVPRLLPVMGEPRCIRQSMISSVLNLWVCHELISSVTVFIWMRLFFDPFDFRCLRDAPLFRSERGCFEAPPRNRWTRWLEQSMISFVLTLWVCRGLLLSVTVFIWLPLFFDPLIFGVYVMFLSERGSSAAPPRNGWTPFLEQSILTAFWIL